MKLTSSFVHEVKRIQVCKPLFLALALCLTTATALRAQLPNPAAYLTFDEGTGTVAHDSSGNNHNATLFGAAGWTTGLVGPFALSLPGSPPGSYAEIPGDVLDTTKSYTVAAWVKLNNCRRRLLPDLRERRWRWSKCVLSAAAWRQQPILLHESFTTFLPCRSPVSRRLSACGSTWQESTIPSPKPPRCMSTARWRIEFLTSVPGPPAATPGSVVDGLMNSRVDFNNAAIDDVRFYASALSASQILQIAQIGNPSLTAPTVEASRASDQTPPTLGPRSTRCSTV